MVGALAFMVLFTGGATLADESPLAAPVRDLLGFSPQRLLPVVTPVGPGGTYRFIRTQGPGEPVAFDPCRPVEIVYNPQLAPSGSRALLEDALTQMRRRTGLHLTIVGTTDERPDPGRPARDEQRYGPGWSPVLLAWSTEAETPALAGSVAGLAGSIARAPRLSSHLTLVSGSVTLDAEDLGAAITADAGQAKVRAIVLHELAHLVGLDHVDAPGELMQPENRDERAFGPGDLAGLARLGAGACRP